MKRLSFLMLLFAPVFFLFGENPELIENGALDNKGGFIADYKPGTWKHSVYTEDLTWNKCLRMELQAFFETAGKGRGVSGAVYFGQNGQYPGFPVKPETTYDVSFDVKGTMKAVGLQAALWSGMDRDLWKGGKSNVKCTPGSFGVEENTWRKYKASFRTAKDSRRAAVVFNVWGDSAQQPGFDKEPGQYFMVDNVSVREHASLEAVLGGENAATAAAGEGGLPGIALPAELVAENYQNIASQYPVQARMTDAGDKLRIEAHCLVPKGEKVLDGNKEDGIGIWGQGDVLEFFFFGRQYGVGAGGGRYGTPEKWTALVSKNENGWSVVAEFPYSLIGDRNLIPFNIARSPRKGRGVSFSPVMEGYQEQGKFRVLVFPEYRAQVEKEFARIPEALAARREELKTMELAALLPASEALRKAVRNLKMGTAPFLVGTKSPVADFSEPLEIDPEDLQSPDRPLELTGAVNEIVPLALTLTNRTKRTENYQVTFHKDSPKNSFEHLGFGEGAPRIHLRQAILMKETDAENPSRRYDALAELGKAGVLTLAAGESAVLWCNFDCRGVAPGKYPGFLRVTPLSEPAVVDQKGYHKGAMADYPVQIEVLDAVLPPAENAWILGRGATEDMFRYCMDQQAGRLFLSTWSFKFHYDEEGRRTPEYLDLPDVRRKLELYQKYSPDTRTKFVVGYSAYSTFMQINGGIPAKTARWRRAWMEYLQGMALSLEKAGVKQDEYVVELFDEPMLMNMELDLEVTRLAHEAIPRIRKTILWCTNQGDGTSRENLRHKPEHIRQFAPYLSEHCFWSGLVDSPDFQKLIQELKASGKNCGIYACSTSLRLSLHGYYRFLPWKADFYGCDNPVGLYSLSNCAWGVEGATCWKKTEYGGIVYRYGDSCLGSIRGEALRLGFTDIRYLQLLRTMPEAKALVDSIGKKVMADNTNPAIPQEFRKEAQEILRRK